MLYQRRIANLLYDFLCPPLKKGRLIALVLSVCLLVSPPTVSVQFHVVVHIELKFNVQIYHNDV